MIALAVCQEGEWKATLAKGTLGRCFVKGCFEGRKENIDKEKFCEVEQGPLGREETSQCYTRDPEHVAFIQWC